MKLARLSLAVSLFLTFGCAGSGATDSSTGSATTGDSSAAAGKLSVVLTDAPAAQVKMALRAPAPVGTAADIRSAVVTITQISLVGEGAPVVLRDTPVRTDLLTLAHDVTTLVDGATIPPGTYTQLRFVISGGYLDVGGTIYASSKDYDGLPANATVGGKLHMPSYAQSGLKVLLPGGGLVVDANTQTLQVDFDVSQSFGHGAGNSGQWVMHPVIKATSATQPEQPPVTTGAVLVTVDLGAEMVLPEGLTLDQFQAALMPAAGGDPTLLPLVSDGTTAFSATFPALAPGDYLVGIVPPSNVGTIDVAPANPVTATVVAGQTLTESLILVGIAPPAM